MKIGGIQSGQISFKGQKTEQLHFLIANAKR